MLLLQAVASLPFASAQTATFFPLDTVPVGANALRAYGIQRLWTAYSGPIISLARSTDHATTSFYATADNQGLQTSGGVALATWLSGGTASVVMWCASADPLPVRWCRARPTVKLCIPAGQGRAPSPAAPPPVSSPPSVQVRPVHQWPAPFAAHVGEPPGLQRRRWRLLLRHPDPLCAHLASPGLRHRLLRLHPTWVPRRALLQRGHGQLPLV